MKKNKVGGFSFPYSKACYKAKVMIKKYNTVIKTATQSSDTASSEINTHWWGQKNFYEEIKTTQRGKEQSLKQMAMEKLNIHMQKTEIRPLSNTILQILMQNGLKT